MHGQNIATLRSQKVLTISQIDSICKSIDTNKSLVEGIAEGGFVNQKAAAPHTTSTLYCRTEKNSKNLMEAASGTG